MNEIQITSENKPGIIKAVASALVEANINIEYMLGDSSATPQVIVKSNDDMTAAVEAIKQIDGVIEVK